MSTICYLVLAEFGKWDGGGIPMRVFLTKSEAEGWAKTLNAYHATKPELHVGFEGEEWDASWATYEKWRDAHPAGTEYGWAAQGFAVSSLPLGATPTTPIPPAGQEDPTP